MITPGEETTSGPSGADGTPADSTDPSHPAVPINPAALAREAMERAKASARQRGAATRSPRQARRDKYARQEATGESADPLPYGKGREPHTLSAEAQALLRRMGWTEQIEVAAVTARWREVIGDQIADHCEPVSFEDGKLTLRASSTAWATQLTLMHGQLRHRLNEEFGREVVADITVLGPTARSWTKGQFTVKGRGPRDTYG